MKKHVDCTIPASWLPSPNHGSRRGISPHILLLHYTGMESAQAALDVLVSEGSGVSCHYLVDEEGGIIQMVAESRRAWHAGLSCWSGERDVNSASIGIEIVNPGHELGYEDFPASQIESVIALARDIVSRHRIRPRHVLAHSDVAPTRKQDPGEKFPWKRLAEHGVGLWVEAPGPDGESLVRPEEVEKARKLLARFGYMINVEGGMDDEMRMVLTAFQRHFRPQRVDGVLDGSAMHVLESLVASLGNENDGEGMV